MVRRVHFLGDREHGPVLVQDNSGAGGALIRFSVHRFFDDRIRRLREEIARITREHIRDFFLHRVLQVRAAGVAAERDEIVAGAVKFGGVRSEAVVLFVATPRVIFHVNRDDRAPGQQVGKHHLPHRAVLDDRQLKLGPQLFAFGNHGKPNEWRSLQNVKSDDPKFGRKFSG